MDGAEGHHNIAIIDPNGAPVAKNRIGDDPTGFAELTHLLVEAGDTAEAPIPVVIETPRGLEVSAL